MTLQHTLGPWIASGTCIMAESPMRYIATAGAPSDRGDEDAANAILIAAAPDLLAALKAMQADETIRAVCKSPLWALMANAIERAEGRA